MSRFQLEKHYGEWMLSRWYDNIPGPDRLIEISTSLSEEDAFNMVNAWSKKLLTPGLDPERLKSISESLITSHWNQACRMGCLARNLATCADKSDSLVTKYPDVSLVTTCPRDSFPSG
ncbi:hypothetical protein ACROYT_G034218 [Oculina patagonica]